MIISHKTAQAAMLARLLPDALSQVQTRAALSQMGMAFYNAPRNGYYDANGTFQTYLRLDIDNFDSGRGCAP